MQLTTDYLKVALPFLQEADDAFVKDILAQSQFFQFEKGRKLLGEQDDCISLPIVLSGSIRVYKTNSDGKEVTLYFIQAGESCFLSANCIFSNSSFPAEAIVAEQTELLIVRASAMQRWVDTNELWRRYVLNVAATRVISMMTSITDIAFESIETRLTNYLCTHCRGDSVFQTHQEIASSIGTAREVVSRALKQLEKNGYLTVKRGAIFIHHPEKLKELGK